MATVRITNDIRLYVRRKLEALYSERIERKQKELQSLDIGNVCYMHYIPARYRDLAQQLNADASGEWIDTANKIRVEMSYLTNVAYRTWKTVTFTVPLNPPVPLPKRLQGFHGKFELLETMAPYEHAKNIYLDLDSMVAERDKLVTQIIRNVMVKCTTLRQVLDLWPTALDFMPDDIKRKHAASPEKRHSVTEELSIDNDTKVLLMKARMLTAGN